MKMFSLGMVLTAALVLAPVAAQDFNVELQRAIQKEAVSGDLKTAIQDYQRIADAAPDRNVKARALLRMADAHRKLGDADARRIYERIVSQFADQQEAAAEAKASLSGLVTPRTTSTGRAARQVWVGADNTGTPSADGRFLSHTDWGTGDLAVRDLIAGTSRRLTHTGGWNVTGDYAEQSAISPDGRHIAYSWFTDTRKDGQNYDLRLLAVADGAKPRIIHPTDPTLWIAPNAWTPDGKQVIAQRVRRRSEELIAVSVTDGTIRVIAKLQGLPRRIAISPDGEYLAYDAPGESASPQQQRDVLIQPFNGSREAVRIRHAANDIAPLWSPDGSRVLFVSDRGNRLGVWALRINAGEPSGAAEMVEPDIDSILGIDRKGALYYMHAQNRRTIYSAPVDQGMNATGPPLSLSERYSANGGAWSPDGQHFAYYASKSAHNGAGPQTIVIRTVKTGHERELVPGVALVSQNSSGLRWFPDGRGLVVTARQSAESPGLGFYRIDIATGALQALARSTPAGVAGFHPAISPDGKEFFFLDRLAPGTSRIVRRDLDSGRQSDVKVAAAGITAFALSPDGRQVVYREDSGGTPGRTNRLLVMPAAGGEARTVFELANWGDGSRFATLGWSRDSRYILFVQPPGKDGMNHLWRVSAAGGAAEKTGISARGRIKFPDEIPGGGQISYSVIGEAPAELWVLENFLRPAAAK